MNNGYYVGIGASAGGLEALEDFFKNMPHDTGLVFIVIQHLSPDFKSLMNELLARYTDLDIHVAEDGMLTKPNTIYLIPPKKNLSIFHGKLVLEDQSDRVHLNLPIDIFFKSLALDKEKEAIGIVLSGTGSDGTLGIRAIKEAGGLVMVQDEESAKFNGMPRSAISTGIVDYILPSDKMAGELLNFISHPSIEDKSDIAEDENIDELAHISMIMRNHCNIDFSNYKSNTLVRRLDRRLKINRLKDLSEYVKLLRASAKERDVLEREFLIGVTVFFRDNEAFESLKTNVIPNFDYSKKIIRIWSAGCSTGEEVYSIAILVKEYILTNLIDCEVKIFATDIDNKALEYAGIGSYPESIVSDVNFEYISKYFTKKEDGYIISESIRKMVVFARHNILKDPPFSKLDLLVCRNLFIYIKPEQQQEILNSFYAPLNPRGYLFLGSSETLGQISPGFKIIDSKWKIYQCKEGYKQPIISSSLYLLRNEKRSGYKLEQNIIPQVSVRLEKLLAGVLSAVSPPSILLDEQDNIVQVVNDVSNHINIQPGQFSNSLKSNMNREQVLFINNLLRRIRKDRKDVMISNVMDFSRGGKSITLKGKLVEISKNDFCLISFIEQEENPIEEKSIEINMSEEVRERVKQLEGELQIAKEGLQATIEELETSNEELHSSNEELIASNEELQSTNEELQSVNEELYTVNNEHQLKIEELIRLNNDLNNLIKNTEVGALYLDIRLTIRKLTPVVTQITNIMESDIGRPISHFSMIEDYPGLIDDIIGVLETLIPVERQICIKDDKYYSIRIRPYRTEINSVEGIIVTFVEITSLKIEEKNSQSSTRRLKNAMELGNMAWWEYEVGHDIFRYSERITSMLGYAPRELPNDIAGVLKLVHCDDYENTSKIMLSYKTRDYQKWDIIYRMRKKDGAYVWFHDKGDILEQNGNNPIRILGTIIDITQYKNMEGKIKVFEHK